MLQFVRGRFVFANIKCDGYLVSHSLPLIVLRCFIICFGRSLCVSMVNWRVNFPLHAPLSIGIETCDAMHTHAYIKGGKIIVQCWCGRRMMNSTDKHYPIMILKWILSWKLHLSHNFHLVKQHLLLSLEKSRRSNNYDCVERFTV